MQHDITSLWRRRLLAGGIDTLQLDCWISLFPYGGLSPQMMWSNVSYPDPRFWAATGRLGYPMNITFINATSYEVCAHHTPLMWCPTQSPHYGLVGSVQAAHMSPLETPGGFRVNASFTPLLTAFPLSTCREGVISKIARIMVLQSLPITALVTLCIANERVHVSSAWGIGRTYWRVETRMIKSTLGIANWDVSYPDVVACHRFMQAPLRPSSQQAHVQTLPQFLELPSLPPSA